MNQPVLLQPQSIAQLQQLVRQHDKVLPTGNRSKPALTAQLPDCTLVDMTALRGIVAYEPGEYTFTAQAGTPLSEIQQALEEHRQYLPFDPPLVRAGATIGGATAAGLNGPGRYRYGGMRDFLLAVQYLNAEGELVRSGSKVVKNAAGFDISKLMIGSLGRLGILTELTFKVFPKPQAFASVQRSFQTLPQALEALWSFSRSQLDLDALDLVLAPEQVLLLARIGGRQDGIQQRTALLQQALGGEIVAAADEAGLWQEAREFSWVPAGWSLVKIPLAPTRIPQLEALIHEDRSLQQSLRRYSSGGQQVWLALPGSVDTLDGMLCNLDLSGLVIFGQPEQVQLGAPHGALFANRVKNALDPIKRFLEV